MIESILQKEDEKLKKYQLLLEEPDKQKAIAIIDKIAPNSLQSKMRKEIDKNMSKQEIMNSITEMSKKFNCKVLTRKEIVDEALKFNLKFGKSVSFEGEIEIDFMSEIIDFCEKNSLVMSDYEYEKKFYILAPAVSTGDDLAFKKDLKNPLLLYRPDTNFDYYLVINGDKKYPSLLNLWKGFKYYSIENYVFHRIAAAFVLALVIGLFTPLAIKIISFVLAMIHAVVMLFALDNSENSYDKNKKHFNIHKY